MIKVTIQLPGETATIDIYNNGTGNIMRGNYQVKYTDDSDIFDFRIEGFPRKAGYKKLLLEVFSRVIDIESTKGD